MTDTGPSHVLSTHPVAVTTMAAPKEASKKKLLLCFGGIFFSYFVYGILQEKITKGQYGENGDKYTYTLALVFIQCIINTVFAWCAMLVHKPEVRDTSPQRMYALMAFSYIGAMVASNHSLVYVPYPTQVLGKSVKPIPVMILGVLVARKRYPIQKYLFVLMIVLGVALFLYKDKQTVVSKDDHIFGFGELLLVVSLALDGMTGGIQDKLRGEHRPHMYRMMLFMNLWSTLYLAVGLVTTGEASAFVIFATKYPFVLVNIVIFSLCSAVGQNFIFMTVTLFGPLPCSIITTTRKFFTILSSVILFQNPMSNRQWGGTLLVFAGLSLDNAYGKERKVAVK